MAMASPSSPPPHSDDAAGVAAVCCMCGDNGLARELFRCRSCRVRLQHSYCSDLYPRATTYRRCNWCLIKEQQPPIAGAADRTAAAHHEAHGHDNNNKPAAEKKRKAASDEELQRRRHEDVYSYSWRRPPAALGYPPVKKKRNKPAHDERPSADAGVVKAAGRCSDAAGESNNKEKEVVRAGIKPPPRVRVKVRRYKLLAEVIIGC